MTIKDREDLLNILSNASFYGGYSVLAVFATDDAKERFENYIHQNVSNDKIEKVSNNKYSSMYSYINGSSIYLYVSNFECSITRRFNAVIVDKSLKPEIKGIVKRCYPTKKHYLAMSPLYTEIEFCNDEYDEETEKLIKEMTENSDLYVPVSDLVERFIEVDEYFNHETWNLRQILRNIDIIKPLLLIRNGNTEE